MRKRTGLARAAGLALALASIPGALCADDAITTATLRKIYAALSRYEATGTIRTHGGGSTDKAREVSFDLKFERPSRFRLVLDDLLLVSDGRQLVMRREGDKTAALFDAPPTPTRESIASVNAVLGPLVADFPLLDAVTDTAWVDKIGEWEADPLFSRGKYETPTVRVTVFVGRPAMRLSIVEARTAGERALTSLEVKKHGFDPVFPPDTFDATIPADYSDITSALAPAPSQTPGLVGRPAPAFKTRGLDGAERALSQERGRVVVLDFWALWCPPCIEGLPRLQTIADEFKNRDVSIWAVNVEEDSPDRAEKIATFAKGKNLSMPILVGDAAQFEQDYAIEGLPQTVIVNRDGTVRQVLLGKGNEDAIRRAIVEALDKP